jgi:hypothetical protein
MLKVLNISQARFIALLAKAARVQSDALLGNVAEADFGEPKPSRGDHEILSSLGLEGAAVGTSQRDLLREAINRLPGAALHELYALMRVGQGQLSAKTLERGLSEAASIDMAELVATIAENPDLHVHLTKALYECDLDS